MKLLALILGGLAVVGLAAPSVQAAERGGGDRIEFTPPKEVVPMKPPTGQESRERESGISRRDGLSVASDIPLGALPTAEDVDRRTRLVLQLLERRAEYNRQELDGQGMSFDDPSSGASGDGMFGIDDLTERPRDRNSRRERGLEGTASRNDRSRDDNSRDRSSGSGTEDDRAGGANRRDSRAGGDRGRSDADNRESFLPAADPLMERGRNGEGQGTWDNYLETSRLLSRGGGSRATEDAEKLRADRMESFRRLLGTSSSSAGSGNLPGSGAMGVNLAPGAEAKTGLGGVVGPGGPGGPGARSLAGAPVGRGVERESDSPDRSLVMPSRPAELDLGIGRDSARPFNGNTLSAPTAPRPMDLFQQKHSARLPTRDF